MKGKADVASMKLEGGSTRVVPGSGFDNMVRLRLFFSEALNSVLFVKLDICWLHSKLECIEERTIFIMVSSLDNVFL